MISVDVLKKLRNQHGWTQEQLATISGVSARTIQRIESSGECSLESKMAIAAAFNVTPKYLTGSNDESPQLPTTSAWSNSTGWGLLLFVLFGILLIQGGGSINERLHINAIVMVSILVALSFRTMNIKEAIYLTQFSIGYSNPKSQITVRQAILGINQLIKFTYISAVFGFFFFCWHMSQQWGHVGLFSSKFANLIGDAAIASMLYAIFIAEFIVRTAKLRLEKKLLLDNSGR